MIICETEWEAIPDLEIDIFTHIPEGYRLSLRKRFTKYQLYKKYFISGDMEEIVIESDSLQSVLNIANRMRREVKDDKEKDLVCDHADNVARACRKDNELRGDWARYKEHDTSQCGDM